MILCDTIEDRNKSIVFEILQFHKRGNPVLVIFQDLREIKVVARMIYHYGIHYVNIFDGKDDVVVPDRIAGIKGAVSLGTNYCGRGTNILAFDKPLHVIISYYTSNERVMNQARGRTARQGQKGTVRIICLKKQLLYPKTVYDEEMANIINEFSIKNRAQMDYISYFQDVKSWIFDNIDKEQEFTKEQIIKLREARINVNRIVAYNFKFPIKMSVETFLEIQSQKVFSIFNCPNSKYTWRIFQKYIREMIFEAWSININEVDNKFFSKCENKHYKKEIDKLNDLHLSIFSDEYQQKRKEINLKYSKNIKNYEDALFQSVHDLKLLINKYLPEELNDIASTYVKLHEKVVNKYQYNILQTYLNKLADAYKQSNNSNIISCQIGFKPYSLLTESGARVTYKNFKKTNYIKDPELKYIKKTPKNKFCLLSITEKIDDLFNFLFQKVNEILGEKTFLKFFMRRTICGCEFGICLNFPMFNKEKTDPLCLIDTDPLFIFTINVKSIIPILAGVLIILLVYAASMAKEIGEWFVCFSGKLTKELVMKAVGIVVSTVAEELFHYGLDQVIKFLKKKLKKQIEKLRKINAKQASIIISLRKLFSSKAGDQISEKLGSFLGDKIKCTLNWQKLLKSCLDPERIMKISFYIILCFATFIMNFTSGKEAIEQANKDSNEYESSFKENILTKKEKKNRRKMDIVIDSISKRENHKSEDEEDKNEDSDNDFEEKYLEEEDIDEDANDDLEEKYLEEEDWFSDDDELEEKGKKISKKEKKEYDKRNKN